MDKRYQTRIERVLQYIENNLDKPLSLQEIAAVSHFSQYHFHRIFRGLMGETLNDYIARRRLERAINMLAFNPNMTITDIAMANGFSSSANFAKAVKLHFGYTPSEIRNPDKIKDSKIGKIYSKYGKDFDPVNLYPYRMNEEAIDEATLTTAVAIRDVAAQSVVVLSSPGGYKPQSMYATWNKLIQWAVGQGIEKSVQQRFAFCYDNPAVTPIDKCRYEAAIPIDPSIPIIRPFSRSKISEGIYAVLYFKGSPEEASQAHLSLYTSWLPNSGFEPAPFPMLEHYLNDNREDGFTEMEIMIQLRKLS